MACGDDLKTQLSRYVDGELSPEERAHVDEHVASCAPCRELLQLFQKNESILSNALSTESFGNTVIESVISEIKREAEPIEARPVEDGATEWFRSRPIIPLAAAALIVVSLIVILNSSHKSDVRKLEDQIKTLSSSNQVNFDLAIRQSEEYERLFRTARVCDAMRQAPERTVSGFFTAQHLLVRGTFDSKLYGSYEVYRRAEGEANDQYRKMNGDRRLDAPEFIDTSVKPGSAYVYKFRAYRSAKQDDYAESLPVTMRVPRGPEYAAEKSIRVQCVEIAVNYKVAKFLLQRTLNGRTMTEEFIVTPGERLGALREVPGFGNVDFRTNLTLDRLENGNQALTVEYTKAVLDPSGREITERFKDGTLEVKTEQVEAVLSIRPNLRALFRTAGAAQADADLWKGSWIQVRAQE